MDQGITQAGRDRALVLAISQAGRHQVDFLKKEE